MVSTTTRGSTTASPLSLPFDEKREDQSNEAFFREVAHPPKKITTKKKRRSRSASPPKKAKQNMPLQMSSLRSIPETPAEQRPTLPQMTVESLKKYQEFEKWQKLQQEQQQQEQAAAKQDIEASYSYTPKVLRISELSDDKEECLSEDIYSLLYTANVCGIPFWFAVFVWILQQTLLLLILLDLVDTNWQDDNQLRIPPGVPIRVNVAQAISLVLTVITILGDSGDLANGIGSLAAGYDGHVLAKNPHAQCGKWLLAFCLQTLAGLSMTVVLFLLVMQSTTVLDLALNFAALSFIYEIDNITFEMGRQGFLSRRIKAACEKVKDHLVPKKQAMKQQRLRVVMVVVMTIGLFVPYGFLVHNQWHSQYLCTKVYIQFNGEAIPDIVYYTGNFEVHKREKEFFGGLRGRIDDRVYYVDHTGSLVLAYCGKEGAWTISLNGTDHCAYLYKSSDTSSFDVTSVSGNTWYAWDFKAKRALPIHLYMKCNDCNDGPRGNCHSSNGYCEDNQCICREDRLGLLCENILPACESLRIDARTNELPFEQGVWFTDRYELLHVPGSNQNFRANNRPIYVAYYYDTMVNGSDTGDAAIGTDFMFFNGRRWVILGRDTRGLGEEVNVLADSRSEGSSDGEETVVMDALADLFGSEDSMKVLSLMFPLEEILTNVMGENYTMQSLPLYRPFFYSDAVDPLSESDKLSPVGLSWFPAQRPSNNIFSQWRPDESRPLMSIFLCSECSNTRNPCLNSGRCNAERVCECNEFFEGSMCERTVSCHKAGYCLNNGTCEEWSNYCSCSGAFFGSLCQYERVKTEDYVVPVQV